ncbi:hypothetical protein ADIARSV_0148 [Arcticibacter svalbardensis MN12-7]|uniref:Uncharacterized protein n=1 Tax=Arcticibacter svalbardensis MN12-7 TaxID=1150600 RepID=R9GZ15_9SPHI|nr:hypothetical protein [Arcticibacter svalbardensis]EOR96725.1 hypothetical protein ADIARSV_0148 [Arcticibacter svalbardensis MN12-7]
MTEKELATKAELNAVLEYLGLDPIQDKEEAPEKSEEDKTLDEIMKYM